MTTATPSFISQTSLDLSSIRNLVAEDLADVDSMIDVYYKSEAFLVNQIIEYFIYPSGKRVRPLALILMAHALGFKGPAAHKLAAMIEFIHTATLLHDDVVDESELRRGQETANKVWGNAASVLTGDFMYSRVFQVIVDLEQVPLKDIFSALANATNQMAEGEVMQLMQRYNSNIDEAAHLKVLQYKTGKLFQLATHIASIIAGADETVQQAAIEYGLCIGIAFQLTDDVLDYCAGPEKTGKNIGDDLADGSPTMPLIHAFRNAEKEDRDVILFALENGDITKIAQIKAIIDKNNSIEYTKNIARQHATKAIEALNVIPASKYREGLIALANFSINRDF